jgi:post-segregation antitoxin (ccd killing protein)
LKIFLDFHFPVVDIVYVKQHEEKMPQKAKRAPQVVIPEELHKVLSERAKRLGITVQRLVADALKAGMKVKQWLPENTL